MSSGSQQCSWGGALRSSSGKVVGGATGAAGVTVITGFLYLVFGYVFANGVCCGDDASIATGAKNLALGYGYGQSVSVFGGEGIRLFDPLLTTGPTLILPAAAIIRIVGVTPWAPGLTTALLSTILLTIIGIVLARRFGWARAVHYLAVMLMLMFTITAGPRFMHWYSLVGEVPATLLTIVGAVLLVGNPSARKNVAWSFLALGLAVVTKTLALLGVAPIMIWVLILLMRARGRNVRPWTLLTVGGTMFLMPTLVFEVWKFSSLGGDAYLANWKDFFSFLMNTGEAAGGRPATVWEVVERNSAVMQDNYGYGPIATVVIVVAICVLVNASTDRKTKALCWLLMVCGMAHLAWFLISTIGNPRYLLIGLLLLAASVSCGVMARPAGLAMVAIVAVVTLAAVAANVRISGPLIDARKGVLFKPNERVVNLQATANVLANTRSGERFIGGWWATVQDLEYMMPTVSNFVHVEDVSQGEMHTGRLLVRNQSFTKLAPSQEFSIWEQTCQEVVFSAPPYLVTRCPRDTVH